MDDQVGKQVRCRSCHGIFRVGAPPAPRRGERPPPAARPRPPVQDTAVAALVVPVKPGANAELPVARPVPVRKSPLPLLLVLGGAGAFAVLAVVVCAGVGLFWAFRGGKRPEPAAAAHTVLQQAQENEEPFAVMENGQLAPQVLRKVKRATVYMRVTMANGTVAQGSGFFGVEPGVILTNSHVVGMLKSDRPPRKIEAYLNSGEANERLIGAQVLGVDKISDLAVLRASGEDLPAPLEVKSAADLLETQEVYVFGFPFGADLGKNITVSKSSVSSLRKQDGYLSKVQVNGGMHPGNSGGPVVNARGEVIGVAVSGIVGTQVDFAVPGDFVHIILNGRVSEIGFAGVRTGADGSKTLPITMHVIDPLNRVQEVAVDVWTGDRGERRPPARTQPTVLAGDSPHERVKLAYAQGTARADVALPPLPPGKVYWVQPAWLNSKGESHWAAASPPP
jgi:S1-C subfamily serine protease